LLTTFFGDSASCLPQRLFDQIRKVFIANVRLHSGLLNGSDSLLQFHGKMYNSLNPLIWNYCARNFRQ